MINWREIRAYPALYEFLSQYDLSDDSVKSEIRAEMVQYLETYAGFDRKEPIENLNNASTSRQEPLRKSKRPRRFRS